MGLIPAKDIVYLIIILAIAGGMVWWHHDAVLQGEQKCLQSVREAVMQQHIKDAQASQDVIDELTKDKQDLEIRLSSQPPPVIIRKCPGVLTVERPVRPAAPAAPTPPSEPANGGGDSGVLSGSNSGDVGSGVQDIASAGELNAIYYARLYEWSVKTR